MPLSGDGGHEVPQLLRERRSLQMLSSRQKEFPNASIATWLCLGMISPVKSVTAPLWKREVSPVEALLQQKCFSLLQKEAEVESHEMSQTHRHNKFHTKDVLGGENPGG